LSRRDLEEKSPANTASGTKEKKYMKNVVSEEYINMLRTVKGTLDPNNIMNPGEIFDL
jgi:FAD/FMN-containing dehydrogenase